MYIPKNYLENEWEQQEAIIKAYPLATVVTTGDDGQIIANHIPFFLHVDSKGRKFLQAHFAKVNPQAPSLKRGEEILVIFQSHDSYISPSYYPGKQETHKFVPTWDFAAVHIYGKSRVIDDGEWVRQQLDNFTNQNELTRDDPWTVSQAPERYVALMQKAIYGLEIEIDRIEGKFKFEQKMAPQDVKGVADGLAKDGIIAVSKFVTDSNVRYDKNKKR
jgi:transcriptional regulator